MAQSLSQQPLPRWLLQQTGGCMQQHARSLLGLTGLGGLGNSSSSGGSNATGSSSSGSSGLLVSQEHGRSISTTRGIYMGRAFIRENLQRHAPKSALFTRENYKYLESNGWSLAACEQVLHTHGSAVGNRGRSLVLRQLRDNIAAAESLDQLQALVVRHAHQMNAACFRQVVQKTAALLLKPSGAPDYTSAALLLNTVAGHLQPRLSELSGGAMCEVLAAYVKCRCSPPADMLQELLQTLMSNGSQKLQETSASQLGQLLLALCKLVQPQGHWPIMQAVVAHTTQLLRQQMAPEDEQQAMQQQQQQGADSGSSSNSRWSRNDGPRVYDPNHPSLANRSPEYKQAMQHAWEQAQARKLNQRVIAEVNSIALLAVLLDRSNSFTPEYLRLLYQWLEDRDRLACLYPNAAMQLWSAVKGQWAKFEARTAANSVAAKQPDAGAAAAADGDNAAAASEAAAAAAAAAAEADLAGGSIAAAAAAKFNPEEYQVKLWGFFGQDALDSLAGATAPLVSSMTESQLGQLFNCLGRLRFATPELLQAVTTAFRGLSAAKTPTHITKANAAWAAAQMQQFVPELVLPALLGAVQHPEQQDGFLAARIMIATSQMPTEVLQEMQLLLRQELHRLSGARGPAPTAVVGGATAADPATAAAGHVPDWVASLADSLAGRVGELRPREIAYILLCYSQLPDVPVHEGLFSAAAEHIAANAGTFTQLDDMEMVATAFERFNFKAGLPALKALQQQSEQMVAAAAGRPAAGSSS